MSDNRIIELDSLRGIAALAVVFYHYTFRFNEKFGKTEITEHINFPLGHYGVELFFLISGFVIFMSVKNGTSPLIFLKKRAIRLFPTFWISMLFTYLIVLYIGPESLKVNGIELITNISMIPSAFGIKAVDGVYWTLKVEWFFYFAVAFMLFTNLFQKIILFSTILIFLTLGTALILGMHRYFYYEALFIAGMSFYKLWSRDSSIYDYLNIIGLLCLSIFSWNLELVLITGALVVIFALLVKGKLRFLNIAPLIFLGKISFALYLVHQNFGHSVQLWLINHGIDIVVLLIAIPMILSILIAFIITYYFEFPFSKYLKNKLS